MKHKLQVTIAIPLSRLETVALSTSYNSDISYANWHNLLREAIKEHLENIEFQMNSEEWLEVE